MLRILIAEDELITAKAFKLILEQVGYEVIGIVTSGEEAIKNVNVEIPDLILMDIILEGELDGIETARLIQEAYDTPIIFITAYGDEEVLKRAVETHPYGYLIKPITNIRELQPTIEIAMKNYQMVSNLKKRNILLEKVKDIVNPTVVPLESKITKLLDYGRDDLIKQGFDSEILRNWATTLGNEERISILKLVMNEAESFENITNELNKSKSTVSHHLNQLQESKLIYSSKDGKITRYILPTLPKFKRLLISMDINTIVDSFTSLSSDIRLSILKTLMDGGKTISEIEGRLKNVTTTTIYHLKVLQNANFISASRERRNVRYHLLKKPLSKIFSSFKEYMQHLKKF